MNNNWLPCKFDQAHMHTFGLYQGYQTMHIHYKYVVSIYLKMKMSDQPIEAQGLSQDLETGCLKLAIVKFLGVHIFRGYHNILRLQP